MGDFSKRDNMVMDFYLLEKIDSINLELNPKYINRDMWCYPCDDSPHYFIDDEKYIRLRRGKNGLFFCDIQAEKLFFKGNISMVLYCTIIKLAMLGYISLTEKHKKLMIDIASSPIYDILKATRSDNIVIQRIDRGTFAYQIFFKLYFDYFARIEQVDFCADFSRWELKRNLENCNKKTCPNTTYSEQHPRGKTASGKLRVEYRSAIKCYDRTEKMKSDYLSLGFEKIPNPMRLEISLTSRHYRGYLGIENFKGNFKTVASNFIAPMAKILKKELSQVVYNLESKQERPVFDRILELKDNEHISNSLLPRHTEMIYWETEITNAELVLFFHKFFSK